jgi:AGCS family alanine or glycine:cation symporter
VAGGIIGALIQGLKRATFSNEAGVGSAAIAHSAVRTNYPASEGMVALLEPFIDTVIICTMSALVITIAGLNIAPFSTDETLKGVELTRLSFQQTADWLQYPLAIAVALFAISTLFTWSYYGLKAWGYLLGNSKLSELTFKLLFCAFTVIGCSVTFEAVIDFSDAAFFTMAIFNMIGLYILMPEVKQEVQRLLTHLHSKEL